MDLGKRTHQHQFEEKTQVLQQSRTRCPRQGSQRSLRLVFLFACGSTDKVSKLVEQGSRNLFIEEICQFVAPGQRHKMLAFVKPLISSKKESRLRQERKSKSNLLKVCPGLHMLILEGKPLFLASVRINGWDCMNNPNWF